LRVLSLSQGAPAQLCHLQPLVLPLKLAPSCCTSDIMAPNHCHFQEHTLPACHATNMAPNCCHFQQHTLPARPAWLSDAAHAQPQHPMPLALGDAAHAQPQRPCTRQPVFEIMKGIKTKTCKAGLSVARKVREICRSGADRWEKQCSLMPTLYVSGGCCGGCICGCPHFHAVQASLNILAVNMRELAALLRLQCLLSHARRMPCCAR
jgi:hypothetical protein